MCFYAFLCKHKCFFHAHALWSSLKAWLEIEGWEKKDGGNKRLKEESHAESVLCIRYLLGLCWANVCVCVCVCVCACNRQEQSAFSVHTPIKPACLLAPTDTYSMRVCVCVCVCVGVDIIKGQFVCVCVCVCVCSLCTVWVAIWGCNDNKSCDGSWWPAHQYSPRVQQIAKEVFGFAGNERLSYSILCTIYCTVRFCE